MVSQASTSMARMWPSKRAKKAGLASNNFMSSAAWRRARKSSTSWACHGRMAGQLWKPPSPPPLPPGAPNSDPRCSHSQCQAQGVQPKRWRGESTGVGSELGSQLVAGAHPARGVGTQEEEKGRAGKTLRAQCFKTLSVDGDAGPRAGRGLPSAGREMERGKCRPRQTRALGSCGPPTALPSAAAREGKANPAQDPGPPLE